MRIPFPESIPLGTTIAVLVAILLIQLIEGTDPLFAVLMLIAQVAAVVAFNLMGGMTHMAGAFCLFSILPNVTAPELAHILLGQPGEFNLESPLTTAGVSALFFLCVMVAAWVVSSISAPEPYLDRVSFSILELRVVSVLSCFFAISIAVALLTLTGPLEEGSTLAALNHFFPLLLAISIMMATYVRLKTTGGKSAMSWFTLFLILLGVVPGVLSASKEGMLTPLLCWVVVVASYRYRFSWVGSAGVLFVLFIAWSFVYPFSQNARFPVREAASLSDKVNLVVQFIRDPSTFPDMISGDGDESTAFGTASSKVGILVRYSLLLPTDMLISADAKLGYTPIERYAPAFVSMVPHAIWPNRPEVISSNELGHKAGFKIDENDTSTGIAIGSPAEFFDLGGWLALVVYTLLAFFAFFYVTRRVVSTTKIGVWGLVPVGIESQLAGPASLAAMCSLVVMFLGTLVATVIILKVISYFTETLISRPLITKG